MATHETEMKWAGDLKFNALQNGKTIRIDGDPVGAVPWEGELLAGSHRLRVEATAVMKFESPDHRGTT